MIDPNIWGEDSTTLRPERFLERTDLPDPGSIAFGFGKRVCPGRALAERISILFTAVLLSAYDVRLVEGEVPPLSNIWDDSTVRYAGNSCLTFLLIEQIQTTLEVSMPTEVTLVLFVNASLL